jgi:hypothetical protein
MQPEIVNPKIAQMMMTYKNPQKTSTKNDGVIYDIKIVIMGVLLKLITLKKSKKTQTEDMDLT